MREQVENLFCDTLLRYPHQKLPPTTSDAYLEDWIEAARHMGMERFTQAVKHCRLRSKFIPMAADLLAFTPLQQLGKPCTHTDDCECAGTGFIAVPPKAPGKVTRYRPCMAKRNA